MVACGPGARRQCIPEGWVCDGDNDCGDYSDEQNCESRECPTGYVKCEGPSPTRRCIRESWLCDGDNDCGNHWDEEIGSCPPLTCPHGSIPCPGGSRRCISERWLCDGDNDCGDNSDEDPENCRASGAASARLCMSALQQCVMPVIMEYMGMSERQVMEKLRNTDLRETCRPALAAQECASRVLSSSQCQLFTQSEHPLVITFQRHIAAANTAVDFVCRDNVDVFNEHKGCLLREDTNPEVLVQRCRHIISGNPVSSHCPPPGLLDCATSVVSEQCGHEIASYLRTLGSKVLEDLDCAVQKRSKMMMKDKMMKKEKMTKKGKVMKKEMYSPLKMLKESFSSLF